MTLQDLPPMEDEDAPTAERGCRGLVTRTFVASGVLTLAAILLIGLSGGAGSGFAELLAIVASLAGTVFSFSLLRLLVRGLLWRVGSRLFVSYLLIGVVPIAAVVVMAFLVAAILAGQLAGRRVDGAFQEKVEQLREVAGQVAAAPDRFGELRLAHTGTLPDLGYAHLAADGTLTGTGLLDPGEVLPVAWFEGPETVAVTHLGDEGWGALVVLVEGEGTVTAVYLPTSPGLERALSLATGVSTNIDIGHAGGQGPTPTPARATDPDLLGQPPRVESANPFTADIVSWMYLRDERVVTWSTGETRSYEFLAFAVRSSLAREFEDVYGARVSEVLSPISSDDLHFGTRYRSWLAVLLFLVLSFITVAVYLVASMVAGFLVARIARTTGRLDQAFAAIEAGDFGHRVALGGRDQLADLVAGFNRMAAHLQTSVAEVAHKESLERELEVARDLQRRLLPASDFSFPGLDIAVDFAPAAAIGGDFYHLVDEGDGRLVVVIADVSGHGLATGIVMASAKASLAALTGTGVTTDRIFATLDHEIRTTTERRTFVTLAHLRFDLAAGRVDFTNAGHLYPYRRPRAGQPMEVANPSRPLGVRLPGEFRTVTSELAPGDHWLLLSDGILEATDPAGEIFGFDRVQETLAEAPEDETAAGLRDRLLAAWTAFTGRDEPEDDRTLVVIRVLPGPGDGTEAEDS